MPPVAFHIADTIPEYIRNTIDRDFSIDGVLHAENTVPALHKRHKAKGSHNVVSQRRKGSEPKVAQGVQIRRMEIQMDAIIFKTV